MPPATANTSYIHLGSYYYEPIDGAFHLDELTPVEGISPRYPEQAKMTAYSGERIGLPLSFTPGNASRGQISWTSKSKTDRIIRLNYELTSFHKEVLENLNSIHGALLRMNRSIQSEGTYGEIKANRRYERFRRRGINKAILEIALISCGFNLHKYHLSRLAKAKPVKAAG